MKMNQFWNPWVSFVWVGLIVVVVGLSGCGSSSDGSVAVVPPTSTPSTPSNVVFTQIERLAVPALNELYMDFKSHDASNRSTPSGDTAFQSSFIRNFVSAVGRPSGIADAVIAVAVPDVIDADLSRPTGTYFGVELAGLGVIQPNFGGRRPTDDPIDVTLAVTFGSAVTNITQGAIPGLQTDNVGPGAIGNTNTFPYLGSPI